jgi:hypothetical protein
MFLGPHSLCLLFLAAAQLLSCILYPLDLTCTDLHTLKVWTTPSPTLGERGDRAEYEWVLITNYTILQMRGIIRTVGSGFYSFHRTSATETHAVV